MYGTQKIFSNLDPEIRKSKSVIVFKSNILKFILSKPNNFYYCHNPKGVTLITRLRLEFSHLCKHEFKHPFQDCLNPLCFCGNDIETSTHYLLRCPTYTNEGITLSDKIKTTDCSILELSDVMTRIFLFGDTSLSASSNTVFLNLTVDYIISTKRFGDSILITGNKEKALSASSMSFLFFYF